MREYQLKPLRWRYHGHPEEGSFVLVATRTGHGSRLAFSDFEKCLYSDGAFITQGDKRPIEVAADRMYAWAYVDLPDVPEDWA